MTAEPAPLRFTGAIRYWRPEQAAGLAVVEVPAELVPRFGGLKQRRVRGTVNGVSFASSAMPAGNGVLAISVSKATMKAAGATVGEAAEFAIDEVG